MDFEFCYQASQSEIDRSRDFFRFASLTRNGLEFTVIDFNPFRINARGAICSVLEGGTSYICCETFPASGQVQIPSIFGVVIRGRTGESFPLTFNSSVNTEFQFPHYRGTPTAGNDNPNMIGDTFTFTEDDRQDEGSLLLLRLIIGSHNMHAVRVIICANISLLYKS